MLLLKALGLLATPPNHAWTPAWAVEYNKVRTNPYASFDSSAGKDYEDGLPGLGDLLNNKINSCCSAEALAVAGYCKRAAMAIYDGFAIV